MGQSLTRAQVLGYRAAVHHLERPAGEGPDHRASGAKCSPRDVEGRGPAPTLW